MEALTPGPRPRPVTHSLPSQPKGPDPLRACRAADQEPADATQEAGNVRGRLVRFIGLEAGGAHHEEQGVRQGKHAKTKPTNLLPGKGWQKIRAERGLNP